jgi:hypothetical protein
MAYPERSMRVRGTIALVLLFAWGVCASTASADPLSMKFTEARANVGVMLSDEALIEAPDTGLVDAQIDPGSGLITAGSLEAPDFFKHITEPIVADVTVEFEFGEFEGSFDQATGELDLEVEAGWLLTANGKECEVDTIPSTLELSTAAEASEEGSPRAGEPFVNGLGGSGAVGGKWTDMEATPVLPENVVFCEDVENRIGGPGGIWFKQEGEPPVTPLPLPETIPPKPTPPAPVPPAVVCVVPKLAGKTLAKAKAAIKTANCTVGSVRKQKRLKGKALVVKSSKPGAGAMLPAYGKVHLKLGPKPKTSRG